MKKPVIKQAFFVSSCNKPLKRRIGQSKNAKTFIADLYSNGSGEKDEINCNLYGLFCFFYCKWPGDSSEEAATRNAFMGAGG